MVEMWSELQSIDPLLVYGNVYRQASLKSLTQLCKFLEHCCHSRHYSFSIKKCGETTCSVCKPVRMSMEVFHNIYHLPDPTPGEDSHCSSFSEVYGTFTSEQHRPSLQVKKGKKTLPFSASIQHVILWCNAKSAKCGGCYIVSTNLVQLQDGYFG